VSICAVIMQTIRHMTLSRAFVSFFGWVCYSKS